MLRKGSRAVKDSDPESVPLAVFLLVKGKFIVAPTDTIYGILADALNYDSVTGLKRLRRPSGRPFIVLIPDLSWVAKLGLEARKENLKLLSLPGITVVFRKKTGLYHWLGVDTLAVRYPRRGFIYRLLKRYGKPLVAPSANPEGLPPARDVGEAMGYFGDAVSLYVDGGRIEGTPSTIIKVEGKPEVIRRGSLSPDSLRRLLRLQSPFPD